jgi:hypothetical protein
MSDLGARLADMAKNLYEDSGISDDDRDTLLYAARLLSATNMVEMSKLVLSSKDYLRDGLKQLTHYQRGMVLGMALSSLDELGTSQLPDLLRDLTNQVEEMIAQSEY